MLDATELLRVGGILLIVFCLFRLQRRKMQRREEASRLEASLGLNPGQQSSASAGRKSSVLSRRSPDAWEVELQELARDLNGEVQTKIAILQRLVLEANTAAARLENAVRGSRQEQSEAAA